MVVRGVAHGQAILECCGFGLDRRRRVRRCETSLGGERKTSSAAAKALREVQSKSPGRHGRGCVGGGLENERFEGKSWLLA